MRTSVLLVLSLLAGCASVPPERMVLMLPPHLSANLAPEVAARITSALGRGLESGPLGLHAASSLAANTAQVDVIAVEPGLVRVHFRLSRPDGVTGFTTELSLSDPASWAWTLGKKMASLPPVRAASSETSDANSDLDQALREGDYGQAVSLADRIADADPSQRGMSASVADAARRAQEDLDEAALLSLLSDSYKPDYEALRLVRFLELVRKTAPNNDAALRPAVTQAFRKRFGDLETALTRPAMNYVAGGSFAMGTEMAEADESPRHDVAVPSFLMGATEVTQEQYAAVTGVNPSLYTQTNDAPRYPVERVTWYDALEFCNKLSAAQGLEPAYALTKRSPATGYPIVFAEVVLKRTNGYRLPTEAEWEWAARGGAASKGSQLAAGEDPARVGWTNGTSGPSPVAEKDPNELGLYDLSGNVWEWCWDWYAAYTFHPDPEGPASGIMKVGRGGSWHAAAWNARVTTRSFDSPGTRGGNIGFRVVRSLSPP